MILNLHTLLLTKGEDESANQRLKDLNNKPLLLQNECYSQLESFVDVNTDVHVNCSALLDKWSLLKQKNVIVYTFDTTTKYYKVD